MFYQVPEEASVQHVDFIQGESNALGAASAGLKLSTEKLLCHLRVFLHLILISLVNYVGAQEGPSQKLLDVLPLDL